MTISDFSQLFKNELGHQFNENELKNHLAILYEFYLNLNRAQVVMNSSVEIEENQLLQLLSALAQLKKHKPIDYIINRSVFFGRDFYVDESVLIPRSETEELVQWILETEPHNKTILDIGSGSGCIPITLFLEGKFKQVDALEISIDANETARKNAKLLNANVLFEDFDVLNQVPKMKYDIVVSNPPYVKEEELEALDKNVIEYEPVIALAPVGADDPLLFYKRMIEIAPDMLVENGVLYWEIHEDLGKECVELLENGGFIDVELKEDIYGRDRMVRAILG